MQRRTALLGTVALVAALLSASTALAPPALAALPPSEWVIGPSSKVVVLTFDGAPKARHLTAVAETLDRKGALASFFLPGAWIDHHRAKVEALRKDGHALGNRGYSNERFTGMSDDAIRASLERARAALAKVGAYPKPFARAPKGARDLRVLRVLGGAGYRSVRWTYDAPGGRARDVKRKVLNAAQGGAIINLDLWRGSHRMALDEIIAGLRDKGFGLRTIEALAKTHAVRWDVTLRAGSSGPEVTYLQKSLNSIGYPAGAEDGSFGYATLQATYAFEKTNKMTRDGVVTPAQMADIATAKRPWVKLGGRPDTFVEIDISRQVLFEVRNDRVAHTLPVSSGNEEYYTVDGQTYKAHTPRGAFTIERKIAGKRVSRLGTLWWPSYFYGGYAIHGSDSVPTYPASHGCVRIPRYLERKFFYRNPVGTPVFVHD